MATEFELNINGQARTVTTEPERPLLDVLREDLGLTGAKYGCGEGQCLACAVLMDGNVVPSCLTPVKSATGHRITTIEGLADGNELHPVQEAFLEVEAMQCGYCVPGQIISAAGLLGSNPNPSNEEIIRGMNGNICRCNGYVRLIEAVHRAAQIASSRRETEVTTNAG